MTDLMKYLTYQALRLRGAVKTEKQMASRYSQFHTAGTPKEWLELFKQVIADLSGQVYLVVDLATVHSSLEGADGFNLIQELSGMLSDVSKHGMETKVKVLLLVYEADWFRLLPNDGSGCIIPVKAMRLKRPQGKEMRHAVNTRVFPVYRGRHGRMRGAHDILPQPNGLNTGITCSTWTGSTCCCTSPSSELIDEQTMVRITPHMHTLDRDRGNPAHPGHRRKERMVALAVDSKKLGLISDIAENPRVTVAHYGPVGTVQSLDVFVAETPNFSRTEALFHNRPGIHAKMLNTPHMADFAKIVKAAMKSRGV
ncbi:hypothetical protein DL771_005402 [Monosporascus sp. 5C6A]|nr:hypothetical protein DL771_005402 [Monosporascus sp. 5C6A]